MIAAVGALLVGAKEIVAVTGAPLSETCCGLREIVYPEMTGTGGIVKFTVLGVDVVGVIVICADAVCPATGCKVSPFAGDKVKSGITTVTDELDAALWA